jgi:hypothetical protein
MVHFLRHHAKEIFIALVLAVVAAIAIDRYEHRVRLEATLRNLKAVATLEVFDKNDPWPENLGSTSSELTRVCLLRSGYECSARMDFDITIR